MTFKKYTATGKMFTMLSEKAEWSITYILCIKHTKKDIYVDKSKEDYSSDDNVLKWKWEKLVRCSEVCSISKRRLVFMQPRLPGIKCWLHHLIAVTLRYVTKPQFVFFLIY